MICFLVLRVLDQLITIELCLLGHTVSAIVGQELGTFDECRTCDYDQTLIGENSRSSDTTAEADGDLHASGRTARARTRFL